MGNTTWNNHAWRDKPFNFGTLLEHFANGQYGTTETMIEILERPGIDKLLEEAGEWVQASYHYHGFLDGISRTLTERSMKQALIGGKSTRPYFLEAAIRSGAVKERRVRERLSPRQSLALLGCYLRFLNPDVPGVWHIRSEPNQPALPLLEKLIARHERTVETLQQLRMKGTT